MNHATKLWALLDQAQRRKAAWLLVIMMFGMMLETLGIGLIIPALALMTQGDIAGKYPALHPLLLRLGNPSHSQLVVGGMWLLVAVYLTKAVFLGFLAWYQVAFAYGFQRDLSQKMFVGYLRQPYAFYLQRNSAVLIRNTMGQVGDVTYVILQTLLFSTELLMLIGISALLVIVEPLGAVIVVTALGTVAFALNRVTRSHILRWGVARQRHEGLRLQHLQQGFGGAKDIKLSGRESDFVEQYRVHNEGSADVSQRQATLAAMPRLGLELLAVASLATLVLVMIAQGKALGSVLPTIGLFAAAAFRLMPSINRVLTAVQSARYLLPAIDTLHTESQLIAVEKPPVAGTVFPFEHELSLHDIHFTYSGSATPALRGVSLKITTGTTVGFVGASGAGKSTLVDIVLGLLTPSIGQVCVDGVDIETNLRGWQDRIGYVPQSIFLTDDTLRRNIAFGLATSEIDEAEVLRALKSAQLDQFVSELPLGLDTVVGERGVRLSGGQRQRIGIARALYHDPPVLVLDEATSALDTATERGVMDAVRTLTGKKTILIVAHRLTTVEQCTTIFRLEHGRLVQADAASAVPA